MEIRYILIYFLLITNMIIAQDTIILEKPEIVVNEGYWQFKNRKNVDLEKVETNISNINDCYYLIDLKNLMHLDNLFTFNKIIYDPNLKALENKSIKKIFIIKQSGSIFKVLAVDNLGSSSKLIRNIIRGFYKQLLLSNDFLTTEYRNNEIVKYTLEAADLNTEEVIGLNLLDIKPQYPNGDLALNKFIAENTSFPETSFNLISGSVFIKFVITKEGRVSNLKVIKGLEPSLDVEGIKAISKLPRFKPGVKNGVPVNTEMVIPVKFLFK